MLVAYRDAGVAGTQERGAMERRNRPLSAGPPQAVRSATDVENALVRAIAHRTGGRIGALEVQIVGSRVVLRGWATSYHAVQLALAGLFEACAQMNLDKPDDVELDIDVPANNSFSAPRPR